MGKGQGRRPLLDAHGRRALRRHCITHRHDSVIDITKWVVVIRVIFGVSDQHI